MFLVCATYCDTRGYATDTYGPFATREAAETFLLKAADAWREEDDEERTTLEEAASNVSDTAWVVSELQAPDAWDAE